MGVIVCPIPGASALISALSSCGIASDSFSFFGFLPAKSSAQHVITHTSIYMTAPSLRDNINTNM